ncbi:hypothetical protein L2E82_49509 [Cichorium intybus]|uniref:Uncharacterized protein n=1 Tax=Cichorium intybus TaxID=13427 RepID=A0ACB8Z1L2_CICIN|nr:hypothetical protein L2E82_49509 [Cichorium intybus]
MKAPLEEADVGISCYISPLPGFRGILKQRYSDFVVNEVDLDGNVVHLTSLDAPMEIADEHESKTTDQQNGDHCSEIESFRALVGDSDANSLKEFIDKINSNDEDGVTSIVLSPSSDKVHRTAVHNFFKERLKFLVTDTVDGPESSSKCIRVRLNSGGDNERGRGSKKRKGRDDTPYDSRGSDYWPENLGKFLRFHLCKENKDTQEALGLIGKMLGIQPRAFGFSGTKDKRAVTTQRVTVFKQRANKVANLNKRLIGIKVGNFSYVNEGLLLGQLHGNRFTITLRGVVADSEDTVKAAADALGKHGFINYFGMQRFGSGSIPTHLIGAKLLKGEWKEAVSMILDPRDGNDQVVMGDLVFCNEENSNEVKQVNESEFEDNDSLEDSHLDETDAHLTEVVNKEDILSGNFKVTDIVLPLPGSRVIYPQNDIQQYYQELADKDGVSLTESMHNVKEFSLTSMTGAYRRVFGNAKDFEWELIKYTDVSIPLAVTDLDIVLKANENEVKKESLGDQLALKLSFTLPASSYATMAIRELLKTSTSVAFHKTLN